MIQDSLSRNLCYISNKCNFPSFRVVFLCSLKVSDTEESTVKYMHILFLYSRPKDGNI